MRKHVREKKDTRSGSSLQICAVKSNGKAIKINNKLTFEGRNEGFWGYFFAVVIFDILPTRRHPPLLPLKCVC